MVPLDNFGLKPEKACRYQSTAAYRALVGARIQTSSTRLKGSRSVKLSIQIHLLCFVPTHKQTCWYECKSTLCSANELCVFLVASICRETLQPEVA